MTAHTDPDVVVRQATPDDAETVLTLIGEIAAHQAQSDSVTVTAAQWAGYLERLDIIVLLAEIDSNRSATSRPYAACTCGRAATSSPSTTSTSAPAIATPASGGC